MSSTVQRGNASEGWLTEVGGIGKDTAPTNVTDNTLVSPWYDRAGRLHTTSDSAATGAPPAASEVHIGEVGWHGDLITVTPTLSVAGAYALADYVGTSTTPASSTGFTRTGAASNTATLHSIHMIDKAKQAVALDILLFDRTIAVPLDNAAWTISDADALFCLGRIPIVAADWVDNGANSSATITGIDLLLKPNSGTTLFLAMVVRSGTPTYADGDLVLRFGLDQS